MPWWAFISASIFFYGVGEYFSELWVLHGRWQSIAFVLLADAVSVLFWLPALKSKNSLVLLGIFWLIGAMVMSVLLGMVVFGESIKTVHIIGIVLALVSGILLNQ
jgi:multidrug transporter EmrE-like cation transporter